MNNQARADRALQKGTIPPKKPSCLIVDDHAAMRRLIARIIRDEVSAIVECGDAESAFPAMAAHQPDWVLMDVQLPGLDGVAAARRITRDYPRCRLVIVSHFDDHALRAAALRAGALAYVAKENLLQIRELIARAGREG